MTNTTYFRTTMPSPIGVLTIIANERAIVAIDWDGESSHEAILRGREVVDVDAADHVPLDLAVEQLTEYFDGERVDFDVPLDASGTAFQHRPGTRSWRSRSARPSATANRR